MLKGADDKSASYAAVDRRRGWGGKGVGEREFMLCEICVPASNSLNLTEAVCVCQGRLSRSV